MLKYYLLKNKDNKYILEKKSYFQLKDKYKWIYFEDEGMSFVNKKNIYSIRVGLLLQRQGNICIEMEFYKEK